MDSTVTVTPEVRTRVRYSRLSREDRTPKNTLVTVKRGNTVYFGIARCNRNLDTFHKSAGKYIAQQRAQLAHDDTRESDYSTYVPEAKAVSEDFQLHRSGLRGSVSLENVKEVVKYFRTVDEYCLDRRPKTQPVGV